MMLPLRTCYLGSECLFQEPCQIPGGDEFKRATNDLAYTFSSGFNLSTISKKPDVDAGLNGEKSDECLRSVQRNESDVIFTSYSMPVLLENITTGPVAWETKVGLLSTYKFEDDEDIPEIWETFRFFSLEICSFIFSYIFTIFAFITFALIWKRKRFRSRVANIKTVNCVARLIFSYFVKQFHSWPGTISFTKRILNCCLLMLSFFVTFSYVSMIKTEIVTVKTPQVIASYQDILHDSQIEPFMGHIFDEYRLFRNALQGSLRNKIWNRIIRFGIDKHVVKSSESTDAILIDQLMMDGKGVFISYGHMIYVGKYVATMKVKGTNKRFLVAFDPSEQPVMSAYLINSFLPKEISLKYKKKVRKYIESALNQQFFDNAGKIASRIFSQLMNINLDISDVESYFSERILRPHPVLIKLDVQYFMFLFLLFLLLSLLAFVILVIETVVHRKLNILHICTIKYTIICH